MYDPTNIVLEDGCYIILTHLCDRSCKFCSDNYRINIKDVCIKDNKYFLDYNSLKNKIIPELINKGIKRVTLVGGEPTFHPDFVNICKFLNQYFEVVCSTNLSNIDKILKANKYVNHWNFSIYKKNYDFSFTRFINGTITLSKLLYNDDPVIRNKEELDEFIDNYKDNFSIKFSTLSNANEFCSERLTVSWIDELPGIKHVKVFNGKVSASIYRGIFIGRNDKENESGISYKVHLDGTINKTWKE